MASTAVEPSAFGPVSVLRCVRSGDRGEIGGAITFPRGLYLGAPALLQVTGRLLMLQGIVTKPIAMDGQRWTLALEWWLFMAAPLLKKLPAPVIAIARDLFFGRRHRYESRTTPQTLCMANRCSAWRGIGSSAFLSYRYRRTVAGYLILILPIVTGLAAGVFVARAVVIGALAVAAGSSVNVQEKAARVMNWLGDLSHPVYCAHGPILALRVYFHVYSCWLIVAVVLAASALALHFVDRPLRRCAAKSRAPLTSDLVSITM
jgi:peptidoglycan/LPS O-acetylase OafA/YrhL